MTPTDPIQSALDDADVALDALIAVLAKKYPALGPDFFTGRIAGRAIAMVAYTEGIQEARALAEMGIADCLDHQEEIKAQRKAQRKAGRLYA